MTDIPEHLAKANTSYTIYYNVKYGNQEKEWNESSDSLLYVSENSFIFDYNISEREQRIHVVITFDLTNNTSYEENTNQSEDNPNTKIYCVNASYDILDSLITKGEYQSPKNIATNIPKQGYDATVDTDKYFNDPNLAKISVTENKSLSGERLMFKCAGSFDTNSPLIVTCYQIVDGKRANLYTTKMTLKSHNTKKHSVYYFEPIQLFSTDFKGPLGEQEVTFEVK